MFTLDRYDGELWTSTNPDGSEGASPCLLRRRCLGPAVIRRRGKP
ncbi:MAG: hypothetical protein K0R20_2228 [Actinomycetia bacterium]|jgi:hypothetical protein|nr:hypothetical protein [Actinomycetes bacterium]